MSVGGEMSSVGMSKMERKNVAMGASIEEAPSRSLVGMDRVFACTHSTLHQTECIRNLLGFPLSFLIGFCSIFFLIFFLVLFLLLFLSFLLLLFLVLLFLPGLVLFLFLLGFSCLFLLRLPLRFRHDRWV